MWLISYIQKKLSSGVIQYFNLRELCRTSDGEYYFIFLYNRKLLCLELFECLQSPISLFALGTKFIMFAL